MILPAIEQQELFRQKNKHSPNRKTTGETLFVGSVMVLTTLCLFELPIFSRGGPTTLPDVKAIGSMQVDSHSPSVLNGNRQHEHLIVTGEMGIILPRIGQAYGTITDQKSGKIYKIYGKDMDLHIKLMEKLRSFYEVKTWPIHIQVIGLFQSPDFIESSSETSITITNLNHIQPIEESFK